MRSPPPNLDTRASQITHRVPQDFATIQAALTAAATGDRVLVGPGTWVENIDSQGKQVSLESVGGASVTAIHRRAARSSRSARAVP